jgi:hypothetical protein
MAKKRTRSEPDEGLQRLLSAFGLWETFKALPQQARAIIRDMRRPRLRVAWGWDGPRDKEDRAAKVLVERVLSTTMEPCVEAGGLVLVQDLFAWGWPLAQNLPALSAEPEFAGTAGLRRMAETLAPLQTDDSISMTFSRLFYGIDLRLASAASPLERRVHWVDLDVDARRGIETRLNRKDPEEKTVVVDGSPVRSVRCRGAQSGVELTDLRLPRERLGGGDGEADVWITGHALRRIDERLGARDRGFWHFLLVESLADPVFHPAPRGGVMVEHRLEDDRLGYLPISLTADGTAVLRTFIFVTMEGTPEGDRLKRLLGTRREDLKYLAFDRLQTFAETDVSTDPALVALMEEAGCGHLPCMITKDPEELIAGHAAEAKRYLRLGEGGAGRASAILRALRERAPG